MPLAVDRRRVAALLQDFGNRHLARIDAVLRRVVQRALDADPVWIRARQERRARSRTDGLRHIEVGQPDAFGRHAIQVWRLRTSRTRAGTEGPDVGVAQVVGVDDDEIGRSLGLAALRGSRQRTKAREHDEAPDDVHVDSDPRALVDGSTGHGTPGKASNSGSARVARYLLRMLLAHPRRDEWQRLRCISHDWRDERFLSAGVESLAAKYARPLGVVIHGLLCDFDRGGRAKWRAGIGITIELWKVAAGHVDADPMALQKRDGCPYKIDLEPLDLARYQRTRRADARRDIAPA